MKTIIKFTIILILCGVAIQSSAQDKERYIRLLNEAAKDYTFVKDDFFPEKSYWEERSPLLMISGAVYDHIEPEIRIFKDGQIRLFLKISNSDAMFPQQVLIKNGDNIKEFEIVNEFRKVQSHLYVDEQTVHSITKDDLALICSSYDILYRVTGSKTYKNYKMHKKYVNKLKKAYTFYQLLEKNDKFIE